MLRIARNDMTHKRKKGRLRTSGPSLGRKRPRRAAIARGATAPQQYATALHKTQEFSKLFLRIFFRDGDNTTARLISINLCNINSLYNIIRRIPVLLGNHNPDNLDFVNGRVVENAWLTETDSKAGNGQKRIAHLQHTPAQSSV